MLKFLVFCSIISTILCAHPIVKQQNYFSRSYYNNTYNHEQKCQVSVSGSNDNFKIPDILSLPIEFPDINGRGQLISIDISEETQVKDALIEIGKLSDINLYIDPHISGSINLKLKDQKIDEVIQHIAQSANLRYSIDNGVIRIEQDLPYVQHYYADFINISHSVQSHFTINNNIMNHNVSEDSNSTVRSQYTSDVWNSLEKGLRAIIDVNGINDGEFFSFSRETGVIILNARKGTHNAVAEYIDMVKQSMSSQVMIEAKIVEIILDKEYLSGIDPYYAASFTNSLDIDSLEGLVKDLDKFGTSQVISSIRIHAINNQQAMISLIENHVYFSIDIQKSTNNMLVTKINNVPIGIILTIHPSINVDTGEILMDIHPTLSRISGYSKNPSVEYIAQRSKTKLNSKVPVVEIREMNSMLKIKSGGIMVIGGLIEHRRGKQVIPNQQKFTNNFQTIQTFIFLKATIVPAHNFLEAKDKHVYMLKT